MVFARTGRGSVFSLSLSLLACYTISHVFVCTYGRGGSGTFCGISFDDVKFFFILFIKDKNLTPWRITPKTFGFAEARWAGSGYALPLQVGPPARPRPHPTPRGGGTPAGHRLRRLAGAPPGWGPAIPMPALRHNPRREGIPAHRKGLRALSRARPWRAPRTSSASARQRVVCGSCRSSSSVA